jgi:hypothetical protein
MLQNFWESILLATKKIDPDLQIGAYTPDRHRITTGFNLAAVV